MNKLRKISTTNIQRCELVSHAKNFIIRQVQLEAFTTEMQLLETGKGIHPHNLLAPYNVYINETGIMRTRGRAEYLNNHEDSIILPKELRLTYLIVRSVHEKYHHQLHEAVLSQIRSRFYIPRLRVLYKKVRRSCQKCKNEAARPCIPQMSPLPTARLGAFERPFTFVGIDFIGPIYVTIGRRSEKRWGVIFTCLVIRAIYLEVAHSLDTSSCIMCISNFVARRGMPREIYSDNGTNFHAAEKVLIKEDKTMNWEMFTQKFDQII